MNLLFICSRNQWRSPTAETMWRQRNGYNARSAGTSPNARKKVSLSDLQWADVIFVMEKKHLNKLKADFARLVEHKTIFNLDIPDNYKYMDPKLVDELEASVGAVLENYRSNSASD